MSDGKAPAPNSSESLKTSPDYLLSEFDKLMARHKEDIIQRLMPNEIRSLLEEIETGIKSHLLGPVLDNIEAEIKSRLETEIKDRLEAEIKNQLLGPALDNYKGCVCAQIIVNDNEVVLNEETDKPRFSGGQTAWLKVWLQPDIPQGVFADSIDILDGEPSDEVTFDLTIDSDLPGFTPSSFAFTVQPGNPSDPRKFEFITPEDPGEKHFWVQVFQKNRKIQVLEIEIVLEAKE